MMGIAWTAIQWLLTTVGLWQVMAWCYRKTSIGKRSAFHREMHQLAYENRDLFISDIQHSVPAFLRVGEHSQEGMLMAQWWYSAFGTPPGMFLARDPMEVITILNSTRTAIKQTLAGPKKPEYKETYDQLYPRFNRMCESMESIGTKYKDIVPIPWSQERLPAP